MVTKKEKEEKAKVDKRAASVEQVVKQVEAGEYLAELRGASTLAKVAKDLGYSASYLGYVEKGYRVPSDVFLSKAAAYFGVDLDSLFRRWGKVPILAKEQIRESDTLQDTLAQIRRNTKLTDEEKEELYDEIYQTTLRFFKLKGAE